MFYRLIVNLSVCFTLSLSFPFLIEYQYILLPILTTRLFITQLYNKCHAQVIWFIDFFIYHVVEETSTIYHNHESMMVGRYKLQKKDDFETMIRSM